MAPLTDEELVTRLRSSHPDGHRAFEALVLRYQHEVRARCRQLTRSSAEDADDLAQEVFLKAYLGLPNFEGRSSFRTWLHVITKRHCLDFLKKQGGRVFLNVDDLQATTELAPPPPAEDPLLFKAGRRRLGALLQRLPRDLRRPLLLRDGVGLTYREIADECDLTLSAVKMRLLRARRRCRENLRSVAEGELSREAGLASSLAYK